jgi:signal peptide peptidase SppA
MTEIPYHRIARQFFNRPLLLTRPAAETISAVLMARIEAAAGRAGAERAGESLEFFPGRRRADGTIEAYAPRASRFYGDTPLDERGAPLPYRRTEQGVAIITLVGEWVNRGAYVGASSGLISYEGFKFQMARAAADPKAKAIILDMESPGGEAVGAFEAAAAVRQAAQAKPVVAIVNGVATSGMYAIASGATRIVTIPSGESGSIGVVMVHLDYSRFLAEEGIKPTLIFAGAHKVDGNPFEPLPEAVRADFQREVDQVYSLFVDTVAAGRRKLSKKAIRETEARIYAGQDAVDAGLADAVGTFEDVLAELQSSKPSTRKGTRMSDTVGAPAAGIAGTAAEAPAAPAPTTIADLKAAFPELCAELERDASEKAASAERERIFGIEAAALPGHEKLIASLKADPKATPELAALAVIKAERSRGDTYLANLQADEQKLAGLRSPATAPAANTPAEPPASEIAEKARAYREEQARAGNQITAQAAVAHVRRQLGLKA